MFTLVGLAEVLLVYLLYKLELDLLAQLLWVEIKDPFLSTSFQH